MLGGLDGLESDEGDLHRTDETNDEKGVVGHVNSMRKSVHEDQDEDVEGNEVDDEYVASPS